MFKTYHLTKYFITPGAVVCACLRSERREVNWKYFNFPIWTFRIKRKRKDAMSVSSSNSVNSAIMYNIQIMIKMSFVIALILRAVMIIVFNYFQVSFSIQKAMSQFIKDTSISEKNCQNVHNLQDVKNIMFRLQTFQYWQSQNSKIKTYQKPIIKLFKNLALLISRSFFACLGNY